MMIKDYMVTTKDGEKVLRSECIRVNGEFIKRKQDAVRLKIDGVSKWLSKNDKRVIFNEETGCFVDILNTEISNQVIVWDVDYKRLVKTPNCNWVEAFVDGTSGFATKEYATTSLERDTSSGIYFSGKPPKLNTSILYRNVKYSFDQSKSLFSEFKEVNDLNPINKLNPGYSFGVEIETSKGLVPSDLLLNQGILPVRDGSTNNYEYVTVPLNNISSLFPIINTLRKNCEFDISTSLHIHLGNVPKDKVFITKFYRFMYNMQDQIFKMFPRYKHNNDLGIKRKDYTQKLPNKIRFNTILNFLNNNKVCETTYNGEMLDHSADRNRTSKWNISSRYYWCNIIPLIFYPSRTIEFRIHQGTLNQYKIIYWLLMCMALVEYIKNTDSIDEVNINDIFDIVYGGEVSEALKLHYADMCAYYKSYDEVHDTQYNKDTADDKTYIPKIKLF